MGEWPDVVFMVTCVRCSGLDFHFCDAIEKLLLIDNQLWSSNGGSVLK